MERRDLLAEPPAVDVDHLLAEHRAACDELKRYRRRITDAVIELADLEAAHVPMRFDDRPVTEDNAVGCACCYPGDGSWPCSSALATRAIRAALEGS